MRSGGCTVQQALTAEAANVVKQAVTLARRRGHAQVTPLHVANTMLAPSTGLLRTACLQSHSHSHPLQCKALELCFNVALNRLPASSSSPMMGPQSHSQHPSISNALIAAFKRAQAHQRRGSIENQQQPLLAVKIELEQLIISILDDPSVSRVMREAGFSSTQVKSNVEKVVSLELCSQTPPPSNNNKSKESNLLVGSKVGRPRSSDQVRNEDVMSLIENMMNKRRKSIVIVGEGVATLEGVVGGLMDKVERGEVPEAFREVKFISLPLFSLENLSREQVEQKLGELSCLVKSCVDKGVVLYLGDLKWTTEYRASSADHQGRGYYCPVDHMVMELGRLVCGIGGESGRFWLMGIATFQTYMRCRTGHPSLETVWGLHPLTIPDGSLSLSLIPDSDEQSGSSSKKGGNGSSWLLLEGGKEKDLNCCDECSTKFKTEAQSLRSSTCTSEATTTSSRLPSWLQQYKDQNQRLANNHQEDCVPVKDLCEKWNSFCSSTHKQPYPSERTITFSSVSLSPSCSTSGFTYDHQYPNLHPTHRSNWPVYEPKQYWTHQHFSTSEVVNRNCEPSLRMYIPEHKNPFLSNPSSTPNSASSSDVMETDEYVQRFRELNSENLKTLCDALEKKVPWQKDIVPEIASTVLQCRSGMVRRKGKVRSTSEAKEVTWLVFQGVDVDAKEKIARELARLVFGSHSSLVSIALSSFSSPRADSTEDLRNKRSRDEQSCSYVERFAESVSANPHRVFLIEDVEQADYCSQMGIKRAIERGRISNSSGKEVSLCDAIVILSCESFSSRSRACSPPIKQKLDDCEEVKGGEFDQETSPCVSLDLNISFEDDSSAENQSIDDIGLLESVDRRIVFKIQEL